LPVSLNVEYDKPFPVKVEVPNLPLIALVSGGIVSFAALLIALVALSAARSAKGGSKSAGTIENARQEGEKIN